MNPGNPPLPVPLAARLILVGPGPPPDLTGGPPARLILAGGGSGFVGLLGDPGRSSRRLAPLPKPEPIEVVIEALGPVAVVVGDESDPDEGAPAPARINVVVGDGTGMSDVLPRFRSAAAEPSAHPPSGARPSLQV